MAAAALFSPTRWLLRSRSRSTGKKKQQERAVFLENCMCVCFSLFSQCVCVTAQPASLLAPTAALLALPRRRSRPAL